MNAIDYLTEGTDLITIRSREIQLRLLDNTYLKKHQLEWKFINVGIPPLLVIIFGIIYYFIRKKRFTSKSAR
jgi:ABC-2 type transport system permease protein